MSLRETERMGFYSWICRHTHHETRLVAWGYISIARVHSFYLRVHYFFMLNSSICKNIVSYLLVFFFEKQLYVALAHPKMTPAVWIESWSHKQCIKLVEYLLKIPSMVEVNSLSSPSTGGSGRLQEHKTSQDKFYKLIRFFFYNYQFSVDVKSSPSSWKQRSTAVKIHAKSTPS